MIPRPDRPALALFISFPALIAAVANALHSLGAFA